MQVSHNQINIEWMELFKPVLNSVMKFKEKFGQEATIRMLKIIIKGRLEEPKKL